MESVRAIAMLVVLTAIPVSLAAQQSEQEFLDQSRAAFRSDDYDRGVQILTRGAQAGFPRVQFMLGALLSEAGDHVSAMQWFRRAAAQGNADAQFGLGLLYVEGKGTAVDKGTAHYWFSRAAEGGSANAQFQLAGMYASGEYVEQDLEMALHWAERSAAQGFPKAEELVLLIRGQLPSEDSRRHQRNPGPLPTETELSEQAKSAMARGDFDLATALLERGVAAGYTSSAYDLGMVRYLLATYAEAHQLFLKASLNGHAAAQYMLATLYEKGQGTQRDLARSEFWLGTSARSGNQNAAEKCRAKRILYSSARYGLSPENLRRHGYR